MMPLRLIYALLGAGLAGLIIFAISSGDFWQAGHWLTSDPWGLVTLADLYLGLAVAAALIALFERSWTALLWIIPLPFLGNVWTIVWFVLRLPEIARRLRS
jgi:Protein of unknown function (DUF1475)